MLYINKKKRMSSDKKVSWFKSKYQRDPAFRRKILNYANTPRLCTRCNKVVSQSNFFRHQKTKRCLRNYQMKLFQESMNEVKNMKKNTSSLLS